MPGCASTSHPKYSITNTANKTKRRIADYLAPHHTNLALEVSHLAIVTSPEYIHFVAICLQYFKSSHVVTYWDVWRTYE